MLLRPFPALPWQGSSAGRLAGYGFLALAVALPTTTRSTDGIVALRHPQASAEQTENAIEIRALVVDVTGAPVAGASVRAADGVGIPLARSDEEGWLTWTETEEGPLDRIVESGCGTAALRRLVPRDLAGPLTVIVRGAGVVRGTLLDASGEPAGRHWLLVQAEDLERGDGTIAGDRARERALDLEGGGRPWALVETGEDGRFEAAGLRRGLYRVRGQDAAGSGFEELLTPSPIPSEGQALTLRSVRRPLVVALRDMRGDDRPAHAVAPGARALRFVPTHRMCLLACPLSDGLAAPVPSRRIERSLGGRNTAGGRFVFDAPPGRLLVGLFGPGSAWRPEEVTVTDDGARNELSLSVAPQAPGRIRVLVECEGRPVSVDHEVLLEDAASGALLFWARSPYEGRVFDRQVPPAKYRVVVQGSAILGWHGELLTPRQYGRWEEVVDLAAGEERTLHAQLDRGATLALEIEGEVERADLLGFLARSPQYLPEHTLHWLDRVVVQLLSPGRWPEPVLVTEEWTMSSGAGTHLTDPPLGTHERSQVLSTGRFVLDARLPGGRSVRQEVELSEGRTSAVRIAFEESER